MKRLNKSVNLNKAKLSIFYKFYFKGIFTVGKLWSILDADFKALLMSFSLILLFLVRSFLPVLLEINAHEPVSKNIIFSFENCLLWDSNNFHKWATEQAPIYRRFNPILLVVLLKVNEVI